MLCVLAVGLLGAAKPALPLAQFLDRMRAAGGEPYRYHLVGSSHDTRNGEPQTLQTDLDGLRFYTRGCHGVLCAGTYFDGTREFSVNINGTALPRSPQTETYLRAIRTINSRQFLSPEFEPDGGSIVDLGLATIGKKLLRTLIVRAVSATPMYVYVDPVNDQIYAARDANGDATYAYRDYRRVGPLLLPFSVYENGALSLRYDKRDVSNEPFSAPSGLQPSFDPTAPAMSIDSDSATPIGNCRLGGVLVRCLLDTGNSGVSISLDLAERLNLQPVGEFEVRGIGSYATEVVRAGPLQVGGATFPTANYIVLGDIHRYGYDVVLGADVLARTSVTIDYAARSVSFSPNAASPEDSMIPLSFVNFVPVVPVKLGLLSTTLAIDTGDESNINLSYEYYAAHSDLFKATESRYVSGVGGSSVELIGEIPQVEVGKFDLAAQPIGTTRELKATAQGHLGAGFLSHFRVILDYARSRIGLSVRPGDRAVHLIPGTGGSE